MKIGEDIRASVRTDDDGVTALTYRHGTKYNTIMLTPGEVRNLVRALEDSVREPLTRFDVLWDRDAPNDAPAVKDALDDDDDLQSLMDRDRE